MHEQRDEQHNLSSVGQRRPSFKYIQQQHQHQQRQQAFDLDSFFCGEINARLRKEKKGEGFAPLSFHKRTNFLFAELFFVFTLSWRQLNLM